MLARQPAQEGDVLGEALVVGIAAMKRSSTSDESRPPAPGGRIPHGLPSSPEKGGLGQPSEDLAAILIR